mmetsp:Transcript_16159/g.15505  ORF Transcript_16159/g.15505 Transcript_16159/m.15505 type:complete len:1363 (+) Transcript_16159:218-4306(+)
MDISYEEMVSSLDKQKSQQLIEMNTWSSFSSINGDSNNNSINGQSVSKSTAKSNAKGSGGSTTDRMAKHTIEVMHKKHQHQLAHMESSVDNKLITYKLPGNLAHNKRKAMLLLQKNRLIVSHRLKTPSSRYGSSNSEGNLFKKNSLIPLSKNSSNGSLDSRSIGSIGSISSQSILDERTLKMTGGKAYYDKSGYKLLSSIVAAKTASTDLIKNGYENLFLYGDCLTKDLKDSFCSDTSSPNTPTVRYPNPPIKRSNKLKKQRSKQLLKPIITPPFSPISTADFSDHNMSPLISPKSRNNREKVLASALMSISSNIGSKRMKQSGKDSDEDILYNVEVFSRDITSVVIRVTERVEEVIYLLGERIVPIEDAKKMIPIGILDLNNINLTLLISDFTNDKKLTMNLYSTRTIIKRMFEESDEDDGGSITIDEFIDMLGKFDGKFKGRLSTLSMHEVGELVSEADTDDGVIDYTEFVPFAADMILALRARNISKIATDKAEAVINKEIHAIMIEQGISRISEACLALFKEIDSISEPLNGGILRVNEFQRCLKEMSMKIKASEGFTLHEMKAIVKIIPRDPFGRIYYATFAEVFEKIRFKSLKKNILISRGTKLQQVLLEECKKGEEKFYVPTSLQNLLSKANYIHSGFLNSKDLISVLYESKNVNLTRLQIHILLSETDIGDDRKIDYFQFIPVFANALELIRDPRRKEDRVDIIRSAIDKFKEPDDMGVVRLYTHAEISDLSKIMLKTVLKIKKNVDYIEKSDSSDQIQDKNNNNNFNGIDSPDFKNLSTAMPLNGDMVPASVSFDAIQNNKHKDEKDSFNRNESNQSFFHDNHEKNLNKIINTFDCSGYNMKKKKKINIVLVRDNSVVLRSRTVSTDEAQYTGQDCSLEILHSTDSEDLFLLRAVIKYEYNIHRKTVDRHRRSSAVGRKRMSNANMNTGQGSPSDKEIKSQAGRGFGSEKNEFSPNNGKSPKTVLENSENDGEDDEGDSGDDNETVFKSESVLFERTVLVDMKKKTVLPSKRCFGLKATKADKKLGRTSFCNSDEVSKTLSTMNMAESLIFLIKIVKKQGKLTILIPGEKEDEDDKTEDEGSVYSDNPDLQEMKGKENVYLLRTALMLPLVEKILPQLKKTSKNVKVLNLFKRASFKICNSDSGEGSPHEQNLIKRRSSFGTTNQQQIINEMIEENEKNENEKNEKNLKMKNENNVISEKTLVVSSLLLNMSQNTSDDVLEVEGIEDRKSLGVAFPISRHASIRKTQSVDNEMMSPRRKMSVKFKETLSSPNSIDMMSPRRESSVKFSKDTPPLSPNCSSSDMMSPRRKPSVKFNTEPSVIFNTDTPPASPSSNPSHFNFFSQYFMEIFIFSL